jgi:hypothetical protein
MSNQQAPDQSTEGDNDDHDVALEAFSRKASAGVYNFLYDYWPTWMIDVEGKRIAPLCRILIGDDDDGQILLDKNVLLTGILHLASKLTATATANIWRASKMDGYLLHVPGGEPHVREIIDELESSLKQIRKIIDNNKMFAVIEDDEDQ